MQKFEKEYLKLMRKILKQGNVQETRNATTKALFGETIKVSAQEGIPLLQSRKIFHKGVLGELAALMRGPSNVKDFTKQGCNYWDLWADKDTGDIRLSYGNEWINYGSSAGTPTGINQFKELIAQIKKNKYDRRLIITGWNPAALKNGNLSLPCCHHTYQWNITTKNGIDYLDINFIQRSADLAVGIPSDLILAYFMNVLLQNLLHQEGIEVELGEITMMLGNVHLYIDHWKDAKKQSSKFNVFVNSIKGIFQKPIRVKFKDGFKDQSIYDFSNKDVEILDYNPKTKIKYKLYE
jgi:thymidylate synthase